MAWATKAQARAHWVNAPTDDVVLDALLAAAFDACEAYAPPLPTPAPDPLPDSLMLANVYQARELYEAGTRAGDVIGVGDYAIRSRPLTGTVKQLLRPRRVAWTVG